MTRKTIYSSLPLLPLASTYWVYPIWKSETQTARILDILTSCPDAVKMHVMGRGTGWVAEHLPSSFKAQQNKQQNAGVLKCCVVTFKAMLKVVHKWILSLDLGLAFKITHYVYTDYLSKIWNLKSKHFRYEILSLFNQYNIKLCVTIYLLNNIGTQNYYFSSLLQVHRSGFLGFFCILVLFPMTKISAYDL